MDREKLLEKSRKKGLDSLTSEEVEVLNRGTKQKLRKSVEQREREQRAARSAAVKNLLNSVNQEHTEIELVDGVTCRVSAVLGKRVEDLIVELDQVDGKDLETLSEPLCEALAALCLDEPWNDVDSWRAVVNEAGVIRVSRIFTSAIQPAMAATESDAVESVQQFRGDR